MISILKKGEIWMQRQNVQEKDNMKTQGKDTHVTTDMHL